MTTYPTRQYLILICCLFCFTAAHAQSSFVISPGTTVNVRGNAQVSVKGDNFINYGTYTDTSGVFNELKGTLFTGGGSTTMNNVNFNMGSSLLGTLISVYNTATVGALDTLSANAGNLWIRSDLKPAANLVVNGVIGGYVAGLVARASVDTGGCPYFTTLLTTNVSGPVMQYQWQTSYDSSIWYTIVGATGATYTASVTHTAFYRASLTTTNSTFAEPTGAAKCIFTGMYPAAITGAFQVCNSLTTSLTDSTAFGEWTSSNPAVATIGSGSGIVTGMAAGTATITYTLFTGCATDTMITVNPQPSPVIGSTVVCAGLTTALSDTLSGGAWTSSNTTLATIDPVTGIATGVSAGTLTITYSTTLGCNTQSSFTVNPLPTAITGTMQVCAGLTTSLSDAAIGGAWMSDNTTLATIDPASGLLTGVAAGTPGITYTLPTGCLISTAVTVNPLPAAITGAGSVCAGLTLALSDATGTGSWSSGNTAQATIDASSGLLTGVSAGVPGITYMLATGCIMSAPVTVNPLPAAITGLTNVCAGLNVTLSDATGPGAWSSSNTAVAGIDAALGIVTGVTAGSATITYTVGTGCIMTQSLVVNPLPGPITGTKIVCQGMTTSLVDGGTGTWSSGNTSVATVPGGSGVVTGLTAGTADITYTFATGCLASTNVTVNPAPTAFTMTGGGSHCPGSTGLPVGLSGSVTGVNYDLYFNGSAIGISLPGTGAALNFGSFTAAGAYTVVAIDGITACTNNMTATATISLYPLPVVDTVTGGGSYCAGGTGVAIGLNGSSTGVLYRLFDGLTQTDSMNGTGAALNYGAHTLAGTYKITATNTTTGCASNMADSAIVVINPLLTPTISIFPRGRDTVCQGQTVSFMATIVNGGADPVYHWSVNGVRVGFDSASYIYLPKDGDVVLAALQSDATCATPVLVSTEVTINVDTNYVPSVTIISAPGLVISKGQNDTLLAVVTNAGPTPSFQWYKNGNIIVSATTPFFISSKFANKDSLSCVVTGSGKCGTTSFNSVVLQVVTTGVATTTAEPMNMQVIPNPNTGTFIVKGTTGQTTDAEVSLEVTDMMGQVVYKQNATATGGNLNAQVKLRNSLANGMYLLNVQAGDVKSVYHVVVEQ